MSNLPNVVETIAQVPHDGATGSRLQPGRSVGHPLPPQDDDQPSARRGYTMDGGFIAKRAEGRGGNRIDHDPLGPTFWTDEGTGGGW